MKLLKNIIILAISIALFTGCARTSNPTLNIQNKGIKKITGTVDIIRIEDINVHSKIKQMAVVRVKPYSRSNIMFDFNDEDDKKTLNKIEIGDYIEYKHDYRKKLVQLKITKHKESNRKFFVEVKCFDKYYEDCTILQFDYLDNINKKKNQIKDLKHKKNKLSKKKLKMDL